MSSSIRSQNSNIQAYKAILFHIAFGFQMPAVDLSDRYGQNNTLGGHFEYKFKKGFFLGGTYSYLFGRKVKEEIFSNLYNNRGEIVGIDNHLANITLSERGFTSSIYFGKCFYPFSRISHSIKSYIGVGTIQHKVRIVDDYAVVPQIVGEYVKGYDRLTNGLLTELYLGYQFLSDSKRFNFSVGLYSQQGYTKQIRAYNYSNIGNQEIDTHSNRLDILNGIKITWILPFYLGLSADDIFY